LPKKRNSVQQILPDEGSLEEILEWLRPRFFYGYQEGQKAIAVVKNLAKTFSKDGLKSDLEELEDP